MAQYPPPQPPQSYYPPPQKQPGISTGVKIGIGVVVGMLLAMGGCIACFVVVMERGRQNLTTSATVPPSTTSPRGSSTIGVIGQRIKLGGIALTIESAVRAKSISRVEHASAGHIYAIVDVLIENIGGERASINMLSFKLKGSDGREYKGEFTGTKNYISVADLPTGDKLRGKIAFEVPEKPDTYIISYDPSPFGSDDSIRVSFKIE